MKPTNENRGRGIFEALQYLHPRSLAHLAYELQDLIERRLWAKVLVAMVLGIGIGLALGPAAGWVPPRISTVLAAWLALPGQLFLGVIQMIVVPLVFSSIVRGLAASEGMEQLRRLGVRLAGYFLATTTLAVGIGLAVAYAIRPGKVVDTTALRAAIQSPGQASIAGADTALPATLPELVGSILPVNPLEAMVSGQMLQIVIFAIIFGVALIAMPARQSRPLLELLGSLQAVCMTVVRWAMRLAPLAVFGLLARVTMSVGTDALLGLGVYVATVTGPRRQVERALLVQSRFALGHGAICPAGQVAQIVRRRDFIGRAEIRIQVWHITLLVQPR